jgi:hypothetical protein
MIAILDEEPRISSSCRDESTAQSIWIAITITLVCCISDCSQTIQLDLPESTFLM